MLRVCKALRGARRGSIIVSVPGRIEASHGDRTPSWCRSAASPERQDPARQKVDWGCHASEIRCMDSMAHEQLLPGPACMPAGEPWAAAQEGCGGRRTVGGHVRRPAPFHLANRRGSTGSGMWALPGGKLEYQESFEHCALREVTDACTCGAWGGKGFQASRVTQHCLQA